MFAATLIVFRESLEAALFVGIVAAATRQLPGRGRWLGAGVGLGALGAVALAMLAEQIGAWFDGLGQDVVNIAVLSLALVMLLWHCVWVGTKAKDMAKDAHHLGSSAQAAGRPWPLLVAAALAVLREGAETVLFVAGSVAGAAGVSTGSLVGSCALGLALGAAVGWTLYAGLSRIPARSLFATVNLMVALLAGAIASQLARALTQAGLIERWSSPVWDSSAWLDTHSAAGSLLHALAGYDAQPSGVQLAFYLGALAFIYVGPRLLIARGPSAA